MAKIGMVSLGCPKNTVDTEWALGDLKQEGHELTPNAEEADFIIINTCGFIDSAKRESIDAILDMARYKQEGVCKKIVVTGCLSERYSEELLKEIPEIDHLLGVHQYPQLKDIFSDAGRSVQTSERNLVGLPHQFYAQTPKRELTTPQYSAYLKLGEGCSNKCAFCIIPRMRGPFSSRPIDSIVEEAHVLAAGGVRELNLVSQDTTMYGIDLRMKNGLTVLLEELVRIETVQWLRLFYCYPTFIDESLMACIARHDKICNYIDVPLQHTQDEMLKAMKRQEREAGVRQMIARLRETIPGVALRTTFITGFPGETEDHFRHMADFVEEMRFDHVGVFAYSDEEGTTAFDFPNKVATEIALQRRDELLKIQNAIARENNDSKIGKILPVLVEGLDDEDDFLFTGRLASQGPGIDGQVILEECDANVGEIIPVLITGTADYDLIGKPA
ncbi:MAG: 30S ribosomal protein S12 methylthiotransferase RimO [Nitrospinae bacterium CG11_big_fil_rev_8_21_14_0_20_45_15]|nr:MAG: 30S ribosomal protein S12 methylthiotransferase RimO [Nitrospinae bacterium CG11_big_fil_rev_8_21_14_0_20_45_15]